VVARVSPSALFVSASPNVFSWVRKGGARASPPPRSISPGFTHPRTFPPPAAVGRDPRMPQASSSRNWGNGWPMWNGATDQRRWKMPSRPSTTWGCTAGRQWQDRHSRRLLALAPRNRQWKAGIETHRETEERCAILRFQSPQTFSQRRMVELWVENCTMSDRYAHWHR
jgi:hypothetical protein